MNDSRLTQAKVAMTVHVPFFSSILFDMMELHHGKFPHIFPPENETAATDGKNIWIDEDFFAKLKLPEAVFLLCHEICHAIYMHMARGKYYKDLGIDGEEFDPRRWNIACDYVINDMLKKAEVGRMPLSGLHDPRFNSTMMADEVYRLLKNEKDNGAGAGHDLLDHHILTPEQIPQSEVQRVVQTAANNAKAVGQLPKSLERFAEELTRPQVTWQELLRHHVSRAAGRDATTWARPHRRRLVTQQIYFPSYTGYAAGDIVVIIDTSGSIGQKELNVFLSEVDEIVSSCNPSSVSIAGCDADLGEWHVLGEGESLMGNPPKLGGGGGTDFRPPFNYIQQEGIKPATLIYFTDMYGPFPEDPGYPVIWCKTSDVKAPFGIEIPVKIEA